MTSAHNGNGFIESSGLTRRQALKAGAATFVGYALSVDKVLAQAIQTDTTGIVAGDYAVKIGSYDMPVYEARPTSATDAPIILAISEVFGVHEWVKDVTRRFAKAGFYCVAPELFQREGGVGHLTNIQDVLKIVMAVPRKQLLGDVTAAADWAKTRPGVRADRVGVTGWCWGGGAVYQVAATNPGVKAAVAWYGPLTLSFPDAPNPPTGFDVAKDITAPFLGLYGENDQNPAPAEVQRFLDLVKPRNPTAAAVVYPGAEHGFFADYRPSYNAAASADGWRRCLSHFETHLKA